MPYRKRYRRKNLRRKKKKYYKRRGMRRRNRMSYNINRSLIVPDTQYCKLRLQHIENILGLTLDGFVLNANSCFDPLFS